MAQAPLLIDPPVPLAVPDGLFAAVQAYGGLRDELPAHAGNFGIQWVPDTLIPDRIYAAPCAGSYPTFTADGMEGVAMAFPFNVVATERVGAVGVSLEEHARRAKQRLVNYEQNAVENALWGSSSMTIFQNVPNYAGVTADGTPSPTAGTTGGIFQQLANVGTAAGFYDQSGSAVSLVEGISLLEQSLADHYYGQGFVHARPRMGAYIGLKNQFKYVPAPPIEQTWNEDVVVLGNGYAGTGKTGAALSGTVEFMWATARILIWRGPIVAMTQPELLDRSSTAPNQRTFYALRQYVVGIDGFASVVQIDRSL